uniref:Homologous recombination OB-fold protein OB-fold domain-containing protein n=1 Tax=Tanacetum cinerariifolium TaxID=118510 RepID=A0A6L2P1T3_TANCI|nr:hypothetical protein [Tanacetum cinerariifolium]
MHTAKDGLRKAYERCNDISQKSRALIDTFLKEGSDKDYELYLSTYENVAKLKKQMDVKLAWLLETYYYRSQKSVGCSSSLVDLYLTENELHLDEEALRESLEEKTMDEKTQEEKIRQKQAEDDEFFLEFGVVRYDSEYNTHVEPSSYTPNPVRIIYGPAGIVQQARMFKEKVFILNSDGALMSTQEYMQKVVEDVGEDDDFKNIDNNLKKGKLDQVVAIVNSCSLNALDDLTMTMKDLSGTIPGSIHYKVIGKGGYGKDITVRAAMILVNVLVFTPKPSKHYLNITKRNMVNVFRKDTVPKSDSG